MFTRLRHMPLHSHLCVACERYEAVHGHLCVYCCLDARLKAASAQPGEKAVTVSLAQPFSDIAVHQADTPLQDYASLLPPYIN
jgi:hypothetical protein